MSFTGISFNHPTLSGSAASCCSRARSARYCDSRRAQNASDAPSTLASRRATSAVISARPTSRPSTSSVDRSIHLASSLGVAPSSSRMVAIVAPGGETQSGENGVSLTMADLDL